MTDDAPESPEVTVLKQEAERKQSRLEVAKIAYFNRTPFDGKVPNEEDVRQAAREFIQSNYALQKKLFGKVRIKLSVSNLLR